MASVQETLQAALKLHQAGQYEEAQAAYRGVLDRQPDHPDALHLMGVADLQLGRAERALEWIERAISANPGVADYYSNLGAAQRKVGRPDAALESYGKAIAMKPGLADAHHNKGMALKALGRLDEAIASYRKALELKPAYPEALTNLGTALMDLGDTPRASDCFRAAIGLSPRFVSPHVNLAAAARQLGKLDEAEASCREALRLAPGNVDAHYNLGNVRRDQYRLEEALESYQKAVGQQPDHADARHGCGAVCRDLGRLDDAAAHFRSAVQSEAEIPALELRIAGLSPPVFDSHEAIERYRQGLDDVLGWLGDARLVLDTATLHRKAPPRPSIALLGLDWDLRPLLESYARVIDRNLDVPEPGPPSGSARVGFVVTHRHELAFLRCAKGLLAGIDGGRFRPVVVCPRAAHANLRRGLGDIEFLVTPHKMPQMVQAIREARLDVLYHWETITDIYNYFLPFYRLAPVQCTGWGIPCTSGMPAMNAYLSNALAEPEDAAAHYTERLVRAQTMLTWQQRIARPDPVLPRSHFGFGDSQHLYVYAQKLQKFHPDLDPIVAEILDRDPDGVLAIVRDEPGVAWRALESRLERTLGDAFSRVVFVPYQDPERYLSLLVASDALLDPPYFGGGLSAYDAFSINKAVVTLPGTFRRARHTFACYRKMGVLDCVATSRDDYVEKALRLAGDADFRNDVEGRIRDASGVLFEDPVAVSEFERILGELVDESRAAFGARQ